MPRSERPWNGEDGTDGSASGSAAGGPLFGEDAAWVAASTLRVALALLGLVVIAIAVRGCGPRSG